MKEEEESRTLNIPTQLLSFPGASSVWPLWERQGWTREATSQSSAYTFDNAGVGPVRCPDSKWSSGPHKSTWILLRSLETFWFPREHNIHGKHKPTVVKVVGAQETERPEKAAMWPDVMHF